MPSEQVVAIVQDVQLDIQQPQIKFCSLCATALSDVVLHPLADALVCAHCRECIRGTRPSLISSNDQRPYRLPLEGASNNGHRHTASHEAAGPQHNQHPTRRLPDVSQTPSPSQDPRTETAPIASSSAPQACHTTPASQSLSPATGQTTKQFAQLQPIVTNPTSTNGSSLSHPATSKAHSPTLPSSTTYYASPSPVVQGADARRPPTLAQPVHDPLVDITRLRVRSQSHHCLYPGATFEGTQKSGRNSYDVTVTIVDVDFQMSTLCGYLRIRGLTDDWPELTTYFDAEIIGPRYGFLTQNWGASEHEDMVHWARFPAFKHVKQEAKRPHLTIDDRDRGAVFMRWKERFLVPDHNVHDINGASFAGFYYVCVDFNTQGGSTTIEEGEAEASASLPIAKEPRRRRESSVARSRRSKSRPRIAPMPPPVATMSGFYYHQNSEPYQQLSLTHVPEGTSTTFEFR